CQDLPQRFRCTEQVGTITRLELSAKLTVLFNQLSAAVTAIGTASQIATMMPIIARLTASVFAAEGLLIAGTNKNPKVLGRLAKRNVRTWNARFGGNIALLFPRT